MLENTPADEGECGQEEHLEGESPCTRPRTSSTNAQLRQKTQINGTFRVQGHRASGAEKIRIIVDPRGSGQWTLPWFLTVEEAAAER
jgi:hypothetical protein